MDKYELGFPASVGGLASFLRIIFVVFAAIVFAAIAIDRNSVSVYITPACAQETKDADERIPRLRAVPRSLLNSFSYCINTATVNPNHRSAAVWIIDWFEALQEVSKCNIEIINISADPAVRRSSFHILHRALPDSPISALPGVDVAECKRLSLALVTEIDETMHRLAEWRLDAETICREERARRVARKADDQIAARALELVNKIKAFSD